MCDLICDVISCCVWSCDTDKINTSNYIVFENQKKENIEIKQFFVNLHLEDRLGIEFTTLMPEDALISFTVSDAYPYFAGQA